MYLLKLFIIIFIYLFITRIFENELISANGNLTGKIEGVKPPILNYIFKKGPLEKF